MQSFTRPEVAHITKVGGDTIRHWYRTKLLEYSLPPTRQGRFTFVDLVAIKSIAALRRGGCSMQAIRPAIAALKARCENDESTTTVIAKTRLVAFSSEVIELCEGTAERLRDGQACIVDVVLSDVVAEIEPRIALVILYRAQGRRVQPERIVPDEARFMPVRARRVA